MLSEVDNLKIIITGPIHIGAALGKIRVRFLLKYSCVLHKDRIYILIKKQYFLLLAIEITVYGNNARNWIV